MGGKNEESIQSIVRKRLAISPKWVKEQQSLRRNEVISVTDPVLLAPWLLEMGHLTLQQMSLSTIIFLVAKSCA